MAVDDALKAKRSVELAAVPQLLSLSNHRALRVYSHCHAGCCDFLKLLPSVGWGLMCLVAIPSYASRGWYWPVLVAIISTAMCAAFAYEILMYHRRFQYVLGGEYLLGWSERQADLPKVRCSVLLDHPAIIIPVLHAPRIHLAR